MPLKERILAALDDESMAQRQRGGGAHNNKRGAVNASNNTIQDLNLKLNEIINYSRETQNLDFDEKSVGNLSNFLLYMRQSTVSPAYSIIHAEGDKRQHEDNNNNNNNNFLKKKIQLPKRTTSNARSSQNSSRREGLGAAFVAGTATTDALANVNLP
jgi:hypothetical protein